MKARALFSVLLSGALFGAGLALSTMIQPEVVLSFLRFGDFGLLCDPRRRRLAQYRQYCRREDTARVGVTPSWPVCSGTIESAK